MDIKTAIETRKSTRGFIDKQIPTEILEDILTTAFRSPSSTNVQPWYVHVVRGEVLDHIKDANDKLFNDGIDVDVPEPPLTAIHKQRRIGLAKDLFRLLEIKREEIDKRTAWQAQNNRLFEAPCAMILTIDKDFFENKYGVFNAGLLAQSICLAAMQHGVSTCITEQGSSYHSVIKDYLDIGDDEVILVAIVLGYEDPDFAANKLVSQRAPLEEVAKFY
ncbi:MAG: hypothetical protein BEN19_00085 [Epulopiscium sp. Nuni2H_MBin003]|nr:MAG: hypothetical protein BEN19_00085 [Epulopiscium sp. Nuni2H_MBin003]